MLKCVKNWKTFWSCIIVTKQSINMSADATVHHVGGEYLLRLTQSGIDKIQNYSIQNPHTRNLGVTINLQPQPVQQLKVQWVTPQDDLHRQRLASRSLAAASAYSK
jgi:hypothetical protein